MVKVLQSLQYIQDVQCGGMVILTRWNLETTGFEDLGGSEASP